MRCLLIDFTLRDFEKYLRKNTKHVHCLCIYIRKLTVKGCLNKSEIMLMC